MSQYEYIEQLTLPDMEPPSQVKKEPKRRTSKPDSELIAVPYFHLDLSPGHVNLFGEHYWEIRSPWREGKPPLNTGVAPRVPIRVSLSDILERNADPKYYLTKTACMGILRRSEERGKKLPKQLKAALMIQSGLTENTHISSELKAYHINQRDEGIDLNRVTGALMATQNMQMQTFVTQASPESPIGFDGYNGDLTGEVSSTLGTNCGMSSGRNGVIQRLPVGIDSKHACATGEMALTLSTTCGSSTGRNGVFLPMAFAQNQRDEVRDLHDIAGALAAQPGMKQQTYIAAHPGPTEETEKPILCLNDQGGQFMTLSENVTGTLRAEEHGHQPILLESNQNHATVCTDGISTTLPASMGMGGGYVPMVYENHGIDSRYKGPLEVAPTMSARYGTGGNNVPLVGQPPHTFCIVGNIIDRQPENGGNGLGCQEDVAYTLTATDRLSGYPDKFSNPED